MKQQKSKKFRPANIFIILILVVSMVTGYSAWTFAPFSGGSGAAYADDAIYREADVTTPGTDCVLVYVKCNFLSTPKEDLLNKINAIRYEACAQGMPDPRNSSRRLTLSDYVPIKWSNTLEFMAQIRACEVGLYRSHSRPGGRFSYGSMTYNGITTLNECLAWKGGADIPTGINMWYGEKGSWAGGSWSGTSHYRAMINPNYTYVAFAGFSGGWNTISAEFTSGSGYDESQIDSSKTIYQAIEVKTSSITSFGVDSSLTLVNGKATKPGMTATTAYTNTYGVIPHYNISSTSSNPSIATANGKGFVTAHDCGTTDITYTFAGRSGTCHVTSYYSTIVPDELIKRIYGHDRYDTSMEAAKEYMKLSGKTQLSSVVIANGDQFPDALSGSTLSIQEGAPTLLVSNFQYVQNKIFNFIQANLEEDGKVYLLGGTGAVSEAFEGRLTDAGYQVERFSGKDRYSTNLSILQSLPESDELLVCCGTDYPDAAAASATGKPVMLVSGSSLTDDQKDFLSYLNPEQVYVIGGDAAVSPAIEAQLKDYASAVTRLKGSNRAQTAVALANKFFPAKLNAVVFAYGGNFPDCIAGGLFAHEAGAPILYGYPAQNFLEPAKAYIASTGAKGAYALGGDWFVTNCFIGHAFN